MDATLVETHHSLYNMHEVKRKRTLDSIHISIEMPTQNTLQSYYFMMLANACKGSYDNHQVYYEHWARICVRVSILYMACFWLVQSLGHSVSVYVRTYIICHKSTRALRRIGQKWPFGFICCIFRCDIRSGSVMLILYECSIQSLLCLYWNQFHWVCISMYACSCSRGFINV